MALHWDLSEIKDWETVCQIAAPSDDPANGIKKGEMLTHPVTNALIWATIAVDIGHISEKSAPEFYARLNFIENLSGCMLIRNGGEGPQQITPEEVRQHIGLKCNVSTMPRTKWLGKFRTDLERSVARYERNAREATSEALVR